MRKQQDKMKWLFKDDVRDRYDESCYTDELTIGKIINKVDVEYLVTTPNVDVKRIMVCMVVEMTDIKNPDPNDEDHKSICECYYQD